MQRSQRSTIGGLPHRGQQPLNADVATATRAAKASITQQKKLQVVEEAKIDMLSTNVKLPSFTRNKMSKPDSPFGAWSRVKYGTSVSKSATVIQAVDSLNPQTPKLQRASTEPPSSNLASKVTLSSSLTSGSKTGQATKSQTIGTSGKIIRRPFEDVVSHRLQPQATSSQQPADDEMEAEEYGDDVVAWINPITKVKSLVNRRTGLIVPASKDHSRRSLDSFQTAIGRGRLSCRKKLKSGDDHVTAEPSAWISGVLRSWDNPIFCPAEVAIPQVSLDSCDVDTQHILHGRKHQCSELDINQIFRESSSSLNGRISKDALRHAEIISQVDKKFIVVKLQTANEANDPESNSSGTLLVIVDQHAADERYRIEELMAELCIAPAADTELTTGTGVISTRLDKPIAFDVSRKEIQLLRSHVQHFANWGILYDLPSDMLITDPQKGQRVLVRSLPPGITERCKLDPKLLIEIIRSEVWNKDEKGATPHPKIVLNRTGESKHGWLQQSHDCPQGILDMLNSRACRSAIMFNDELSKEQCKTLLSRLADCAFPFQCAHGRPSMIPLVDLGRLRVELASDVAPNMGHFGADFKKWKRNMSNDIDS